VLAAKIEFTKADGTYLGNQLSLREAESFLNSQMSLTPVKYSLHLKESKK
jgi:hypothetical protein